MKAVGIIAEYNPFHNGHQYHIEEAKKNTNADVTIAAMSGNFTQRGEPTILDKWHRANEALHNGIDVVVELPLAFSVQPSHLFAQGALTILDALKVSDIVFGAEHSDWNFERLVRSEKNFDKNQFELYNETFATAFNEQLKQNTGIELTDPNDILAFSYFKAKKSIHASANLLPIKRIGNKYHDLEISGRFSSASSIRSSIANGSFDFVNSVPDITKEDLLNIKKLGTWENLYPYLRYTLIQSPVSELCGIYQMAEGLEYRMKSVAENASSFDEFIHELKTKRYTYSRLIRVSLYALLHITDGEMSEHYQTPYIRILGFNKRGQQYLHEIRKKLHMQAFTRLSRDQKVGVAQLDFRAGKMYQMINHSEQQDMKRKPIILL